MSNGDGKFREQIYCADAKVGHAIMQLYLFLIGLTLLRDKCGPYLHLGPSRWAPHDETQSPCSKVGWRSVTDLALLCTKPQSSSMSLDKHLRKAEQREDNVP